MGANDTVYGSCSFLTLSLPIPTLLPPFSYFLRGLSILLRGLFPFSFFLSFINLLVCKSLKEA